MRPDHDIQNLTERTSPSKAPLAMRYIHRELEVSREESDRLRQGTIDAALASRRLLLILDLDHTLLHSTRFTDLNSKQMESLHTMHAAQPSDRAHRLLYHVPRMGMWTKLRPGLVTFLSMAREIFDLHVFTMGDKGYAAEIAAILDPEGRLFGGRVASSLDAGPSGVKDIDVLLGAEELVLIIDDTVGVWPKHRDNLVQIERYVYFPGCAITFGGPGASLMERGLDEDETNGALTACLRVMTEVHRRFFAELDEQKHHNKETFVDVRRHLRALRRTILEGCCVLFTRVIPRNGGDPSEHPIWQLATALGARCVVKQSDEVTHVVAGDATDKTRWARETGKYVVPVEWLISCGFTWQRADEAKFPLTTSNGAASLPVQFAGDDVAAALKAAGGGISNKTDDH